MRKSNLILFLIISFICFSILNVYAGFRAKPDFRLEELYRLDIKAGKSNLLISHLNAAFSYMNKAGKGIFKLIPYIENRWNHKHDIWVRHEFGIEAGKDITPWFYLGEGLHYTDLNEDDRDREDFRNRNTTEWESRIKFHMPLIKDNDSGRVKLKGYVLDEFTYDLNEGEGGRNEVAIGVVMPLGKNAEANLNWRHIDRIHYYDSDNVEVSFSLLF